MRIKMRFTRALPTHLALFLILQACNAGMSSPNILIPRSTEWLPRDNQTVYRLDPGSVRRLELNASGARGPVFITVSPCVPVHWAVYRGRYGDGYLNFVEEHTGSDMAVFSTVISDNERYVLQLTASRSGAAAISVRGERPKSSRLRLRVRSRRRLAAVWDPSPIDPHATSYCVVASHKKNYTSLCAAHQDIKSKVGKSSSEEKSRSDRYSTYRVRKADRFSEEKRGMADSFEKLEQSSISSEQNSDSGSIEDNKIVAEDVFAIQDGDYGGVVRRKKFSRSTRISEQDPVIACVGDRTHHFIDNLDISKTYFVSVFGVAQDKKAGTLLASGSVAPKSSVALKLKENVAYKADVRGRMVFYYKTTTSNGIWLALTTCGGAVDIDVSAQGKKLYAIKNIDPYKIIFIPAPGSQESGSLDDSTSLEGSRSLETTRYVVKVTPSRRRIVRVELTASSSRSGISAISLNDFIVRELRPRRTCRSVDVAFLPASGNATDVIRYCTSARVILDDGPSFCDDSKGVSRSCVSHSQRTQSKVIIQRINSLSPGLRYEVRVVASTANGSVPYRTLNVETHSSCKMKNSLN